MASGLPDYFRAVRPRYGAAKSVMGSKTLTAHSENTLVSISGKGMLYGGNMRFDGVLLDRWDVIHLYIDNVLFYQTNFYSLNLAKYTIPGTNAIFIQSYNEVEGLYSIGVSSGYTFESCFKFSITENRGNTPDVFYNIFYALIT